MVFVRRWRWVLAGVGLVFLVAAGFVASVVRQDDLEALRPYVMFETLDYTTTANELPAITAALGHPAKPMMTRTLRVRNISANELMPILEAHVANLEGWDKPVVQTSPLPSFTAKKGKTVMWYGDQIRLIPVTSLRPRGKAAAAPRDFMIIETRTLSWWELQVVKLKKWRRKSHY